jgi:SAM-dependent methyltransferase
VARLSTSYLAQLHRGIGEHWSGPRELVDLLARVLDPSPKTRVLDVGCGIGGPARRLRELRGCRIVACDVLEDLVWTARRLTPGGEGISFLVGHAERLPFAAASFDHVWALGVLAHTRFVTFADEARRVLADGGIFAAVEVLGNGRAPPRFAGCAPEPWTPYTPSEIRRALAQATFSSVELSAPEALQESEPLDGRLRQDLADGRLAPHLIVARVA